jgi:hypothetical protein
LACQPWSQTALHYARRWYPGLLFHRRKNSGGVGLPLASMTITTIAHYEHSKGYSALYIVLFFPAALRSRLRIWSLISDIVLCTVILDEHILHDGGLFRVIHATPNRCCSQVDVLLDHCRIFNPWKQHRERDALTLKLALDHIHGVYEQAEDFVVQACSRSPSTYLKPQTH